MPSTIHLPANLYVAGTINVDETTHAVSPKVLDRSFTIEIEAGAFGSYGTPTRIDIDIEALTAAFTREAR